MSQSDPRGTVESHPFEPFLPEGACVLFLGSFPPQPKRWSMDFYYPNFINDFWRICGLLFFRDKDHFVLPGQRRFDKACIQEFCAAQGIALYDTAAAVRRRRDNASDLYLEVVTPTDLEALLARIPQCRAVVTTGQKATDTLVAAYGCPEPALGDSVPLPRPAGGEPLRFWRLPSTSRAYPLPLERKAAAYRILFESLGLIRG